MSTQSYVQAYYSSPFPVYPQAVAPVNVAPVQGISQAEYPQDNWQPRTPGSNARPTDSESSQEPHKRGHGILRPLEPGQEIPEYMKRELNPFQQAGVFLIENLYQRIGIKQDVWGRMEDMGIAVCPYTRRANQEGIKGWEGCSQYTKMAIVRDGFFIGCFEGGMRMLTEPFVFLFKTPTMERYIERHARIIMPQERFETSASPRENTGGDGFKRY